MLTRRWAVWVGKMAVLFANLDNDGDEEKQKGRVFAEGTQTRCCYPAKENGTATSETQRSRVQANVRLCSPRCPYQSQDEVI